MKDGEDVDARPADPLLGTELSEDGVDETRRFFVGDGPSDERKAARGLKTGGDAEGVINGRRSGFRDGALDGGLDDGRTKLMLELIVRDDLGRAPVAVGGRRSVVANLFVGIFCGRKRPAIEYSHE